MNILWAGSSVTGKAALDAVGPFTVIVARFAPSCVLLWLLLRIQGVPLRVRREDLWRFLLLGGLGIVLTYAIFYSGMKGSTATEANLVIAAEPIIVALMAAVLLKERLRPVQAVGLAVGFAGLYVLIMRGIAPRFEGAALSNAVMTAALLFECLASIIGKSLTARYAGLVVVTLEFAVGALLAAPFAAWELWSRSPGPLSGAVWGSLAYLALACSFISYGVWYWLLPRYNISAMAGFLFLQPVAGPIMAYYFRQEPMAPATFVGAVLVLLGIWLVAIVGGRGKPGEPSV